MWYIHTCRSQAKGECLCDTSIPVIARLNVRINKIIHTCGSVLNVSVVILYVWRIPEGRINSGCGSRSQWCLQQSPVQAADGPAHAIWSQPNTDPVDCRSTSGKNSGYAAWKLELCSSSAHNGPTTRITDLAGPLQCIYTKGLADLNQNGPSKNFTLVDDGLIYKASRDSQEAAEAVQQVDSVSQWCHITRSFICPDEAQTLVHSWQQSSRQTSARNHIWWSCGWTNKASEIPWDPLWQNADLQKTCGNNSTEQAWEFCTKTQISMAVKLTPQRGGKKIVCGEKKLGVQKKKALVLVLHQIPVKHMECITCGYSPS